MIGRVWQTLGLALLLATSPFAGQTSLPAPAAGEAPNGQEVHAALDRLREAPSPIGVQAILQSWVREFPGRVSLETYGQSTAGRALVMLRIAPPPTPGQATTEQGRAPSALLVPTLGPEHDPVAFLTTLYGWLSAPSQTVPFELCVAVLPDPDGWVEGERTACLERNFPSGWTPWCEDGSHPGTAPLSQVECKALARWSLTQTSLMGVVRWLPRATPDARRAPGSLQRYAAEVWGVPVHLAGQQGLWPALQALEVGRDRVGGQVRDVERLAQNLWVVDVELRNVGQGLPGSEALRRSAALVCSVTGGRIQAVALAPLGAETAAGDPYFELWAGPGDPPLPPPGQAAAWRLVIETQEQDALYLHFTNPRLDRFSLTAPLPFDPPRPR